MNLSAHYRALGADITFTRDVERGLFEDQPYEHVYGSAIFNFIAPRVEAFRKAFPAAIIGGSWDLCSRMSSAPRAMRRSADGQPAVRVALRHQLRGHLAILAAQAESESRMYGYSARKRAKRSTKGAKLHPPKRKFGLEEAWGDHPDLFLVEGIALAKCLAEQCFLRVGSPREGGHNPGQHDNEGRPAAEGQRLARGEQDQA